MQGKAVAIAAGSLLLLFVFPKLVAFILGTFGWLVAFPLMTLADDFFERSSIGYARSSYRTAYKVLIYLVMLALTMTVAVFLGFNLANVSDAPMRDQRGYY
jgi:hypothetical protein